MDLSTLLLLAAGIAGTWIGAELLVRGAAHLALSLGIRPVVVGLTVVALGTSSPEAVASFVAATRGVGGIAVGNVLGSNIANIGLILGAVCLLHPLRVGWTELRRDVVIMVVATCLASVFVYADALARPAGAIFLALWLVSGVLTVREARRTPSAPVPADERVPSGGRSPAAIAVGQTVIGLAILVFGADALVEAATELGRQLGIAEDIIGATVVAVGTSLPEFAASLVAVARGHHEIGIGNIVGSNAVNLLFVLGGVCVLAPQPVTPEMMRLLVPAMLLFTFALVPILRFGGRVGRPQAGVLFVGYVAFAMMSFR